MADTRLEQLANVLVSHSAGVEPGDVVYIESTPVAAPLVRELYRYILSAGGYPQSHVALPGAQEALVTLGSDDQLDWVSPRVTAEFELADARILIVRTREHPQPERCPAGATRPHRARPRASAAVGPRADARR